MKHLIITLLTTSAFCLTTATLELKGFIAPIVDIAVVALPISNTLNLAQNANDLTVANSTESSNSSTGYKVTISSSNDGKLKHIDNTVIPYTLKYGATSTNLNSGGIIINRASVGVVSVSEVVSISYTAVDPVTLSSGDYTDLVTFEISPN